ncbi:MAG: Fic family protein [archaeon]|nr:Fic family protein [archaeon]
MVYTEIKERNGKKYFYRVINVREGKKFKKRRIYLGVNLDKKAAATAELLADKELSLFSNLLEDKELNFLVSVKKEFAKEPKANEDNRYEAFTSLFTYDSNAIEGNSLTLEETSFLLFEKRVPSAKSLREINETLNHKSAFDYMLSYKGDISKEFICELHKLVVQNTLREDLIPEIGKYRTLQVYIHGRDWIPPKPEEAPGEMKSLLSWYAKNNKKLHPLILATYFHVAFETIHPFVDGNGRVGRLLMNFILHKYGYPMINIPNKIKFKYYESLKEATLTGNLRLFIEILLNLYEEMKLRF